MATATVPSQSATPSRRELLDRLSRLLPPDDSLQLLVEGWERLHGAQRPGHVRYEAKVAFGRATEGAVEIRMEARRR